MSNIQATQAQLVDMLALNDDDERWFLKILGLFKPHHGIRSIALDDIRFGLQDMMPEAVPAYDAFRRLLPSAAPFSFLPVEAMALLSARAGALVWPDVPLQEASRRWSRYGSKRFFKNPLFLMTRQAADNKFEDYLEMSSDNQVMNFGQSKLYRVGPGHYEQVVTDQYSAWAEVSMIPFLDSLLEEFQLEGRIEFEAQGPYAFRLDIIWKV